MAQTQQEGERPKLINVTLMIHSFEMKACKQSEAEAFMMPDSHLCLTLTLCCVTLTLSVSLLFEIKTRLTKFLSSYNHIL